MFSSTQVPNGCFFESHPQISRSACQTYPNPFFGLKEMPNGIELEPVTCRLETPGHDVHIYFFLPWERVESIFFLAVFEVDENSEKKPMSRCIFLLPLAGGALANPE